MKKKNASLIAGILCLAAAAAWHSLDVKTGIQATGASWQMGQYLLLSALVAALAAVCGYFLLEKNIPWSFPKLAVLMALYYLAAAVMQPVCDKRLAACMAQNAVGHGMLLEIVGYSLALFAVTIAVISYSTNAVYYAG